MINEIIALPMAERGKIKVTSIHNVFQRYPTMLSTDSLLGLSRPRDAKEGMDYTINTIEYAVRFEHRRLSYIPVKFLFQKITINAGGTVA